MDPLDDSMESYNRRQYDLMLRSIDLFEGGSTTFPLLVANLESLLDALKQLALSWIENFQSRWGTLEDVYASMLDEGRSDLNDLEHELVIRALADLKSMISEVRVEKRQDM